MPPIKQPDAIPADSANPEKRQKMKLRVLKCLRMTVERLEALVLEQDEYTRTLYEPLTQERIARVLDWADRASEERAGIPEEVEEDVVLTQIDRLRERLEVLNATCGSEPLSESVWERYTYPEFYHRIVEAAEERTSALHPPLIAKWGLPLVLRGIGTGASMRLRERWLEMDVGRDLVIQSLAGVDTPEAMAMRLRLRSELLAVAERFVDPSLLPEGVTSAEEGPRLVSEMLYESVLGVDTEEAMEFRKQALALYPKSVDEFVYALRGLASEASMDARQAIVNKSIPPSDASVMSLLWVLKSLSGIDTIRAESIRQQVEPYWDFGYGVIKDGLIESYTGIDSPKSIRVRRTYLNEVDRSDSDALYEREFNVAVSLAGVASDEAMNIRRDLWEDGASAVWIMSSLWGVDTPEAWSLREEVMRPGGVSSASVLESVGGIVSVNATQKYREPEIRALMEGGYHKGQVGYEDLVGDYSNAAFGLRKRIKEVSEEAYIRSFFAKDPYKHLQLLQKATERAMETVL